MKKLIGIISVFVFVSCLLSSCASHERCPAYGDIDLQIENQEEQV